METGLLASVGGRFWVVNEEYFDGKQRFAWVSDLRGVFWLLDAASSINKLLDIVFVRLLALSQELQRFLLYSRSP